MKLKRGWSGSSLNTKYGDEDFLGGNLLEAQQWQNDLKALLKNIRQNKHTWRAIWNGKKIGNPTADNRPLNALLSARDVHLIGGNANGHWSRAGCKLVISLCGCQSAALKRTRWQACNKHRRRSCRRSVGASAGEKGKAKGSKGTGTLKHGALKCLPLRHSVGIMHGEASCYVKIILHGSLWGLSCL